MTTTTVDRLLADQDGVISRRQVRECGLGDPFIARQVRRRLWTTLHRGVYVDHTGAPSWRQRAWGAVLYSWPAALYGPSALTAFGMLPAGPLLHVAVEHGRNVAVPRGVRRHRVRGLGDQVSWNLGPPRIRLEQSVLAAASQSLTASGAVAMVADACQSRRTTPARLREALATRARVRHGRWLRAVLDDVDEGALSVLEHNYLTRVERRHGLPRGRRQGTTRTADGVVHRDVEYDAQHLVVELDGRLGHELIVDRWHDMDRDLLAAIAGQQTIRLGWVHAEELGCRTAARLGRLLQARGWAGRPTSCGASCDVEVGLIVA